MKNILFVDDEYEALAEVRRALEPQRLRWTVHCALDGQSALDLCRTLTFDLVIARQLMQGMDGVTLLKHLAATQPGAARLLVADSAELDLARAARAASLAHRLLTKPFQPAELVAAIERITCLQELFSTPALRATIGRIGGLPSLSHTFTTLSLEVRNPEATVSNVARIIENDIAMAAKVLQLVNSGFFGLSQRMTNLQTAVSYLGLDTIRNLALAAETFTLFKPDLCLPKAFLESLQRRANRAAAIAGALHLNIRERDTAVVGAAQSGAACAGAQHATPVQRRAASGGRAKDRAP
jgi:CheY-like chemotaxis protein